MTHPGAFVVSGRVVPGEKCHTSGSGTCRYPLPVEIFFTTLLVAMGVLTTWFAFYVVYRLYIDQR